MHKAGSCHQPVKNKKAKPQYLYWNLAQKIKERLPIALPCRQGTPRNRTEEEPFASLNQEENVMKSIHRLHGRNNGEGSRTLNVRSQSPLCLPFPPHRCLAPIHLRKESSPKIPSILRSKRREESNLPTEPFALPMNIGENYPNHRVHGRESGLWELNPQLIGYKPIPLTIAVSPDPARCRPIGSTPSRF